MPPGSSTGSRYSAARLVQDKREAEARKKQTARRHAKELQAKAIARKAAQGDDGSGCCVERDAAACLCVGDRTWVCSSSYCLAIVCSLVLWNVYDASLHQAAAQVAVGDTVVLMNNRLNPIEDPYDS
eukprot:SAG22_NODE_11624_length_476_cov_1.103448_1_plen_127_part_00